MNWILLQDRYIDLSKAEQIIIEYKDGIKTCLLIGFPSENNDIRIRNPEDIERICSIINKLCVI